MTAPVGAAPSMLRPGQHAVAFPRATLKARTAHGPLGYPLSSSSSHDRRRVVPRKVSGSICRTLLVFRSSSPMCASLPRFRGGAFGVCDARSSLGPSRRPLLRRSSSLFSSPRRSVPWRPLRPPTPQNRPAYHGLPGGCHRAPSLRRVLLNRNGTHLLVHSWTVCLPYACARWGGQNARLFAK